MHAIETFTSPSLAYVEEVNKLGKYCYRFTTGSTKCEAGCDEILRH